MPCLNFFKCNWRFQIKHFNPANVTMSGFWHIASIRYINIVAYFNKPFLFDLKTWHPVHRNFELSDDNFVEGCETFNEDGSNNLWWLYRFEIASSICSNGDTQKPKNESKLCYKLESFHAKSISFCFVCDRGRIPAKCGASWYSLRFWCLAWWVFGINQNFMPKITFWT